MSSADDNGLDGEGKEPAATDRSHAHARDPDKLTAADPPTLDERVAFFAELMLRNEFITGVTSRRYAKQWGLHVDTVSRDASTASKFFRADPKEIEDRKARWLAKLEGAQLASIKAERLEALKGLLELEAKAGGYMEPEKHEHTHLNADARIALLERIAGCVASEAAAGETGEDHPGPKPGGS